MLSPGNRNVKKSKWGFFFKRKYRIITTERYYGVWEF